MKIAVINFSGNVGKSTIARHLLLPRIPDAELLSVESLNADENTGRAVRGREFGALQEYLQTIDHAVIDIGASNVEDLLALMRRYQGSHEDVDAFVIPTVPALKQQKDTIATLVDLSRLGVPPERMKLVFNMNDGIESIEASFFVLLAFLAEHPIANASLDCRLSFNEVYRRATASGRDLRQLAFDTTDYKAMIQQATGAAEKSELAQQLATRRLAIGVLPELDACFASLDLDELANPVTSSAVHYS
ncbi:hypothetical protein LC605_23075 [Nostoc sp. CHAB 5836]|nr:hypothetical protein [Nostoc sp. CHAB 5836]